MSLVSRAIWQIEMRLDEPLDLGQLAQLCAVSPYHLSRCFRHATGLAPITYQRARRLSVAAQKLAFGQEEILPVAIESGYNSHEAFTRAFSDVLGARPRDIRKTGSLDTLTLPDPFPMTQTTLPDLAPPEIKPHAAFHVIGLSLQCSFEDTSGIPALWGRFNAREAEIEHAIRGTAYGICHGATDAGQFTYMAACEVPADARPPADMDRLTIPANRYAVFTHRGHISTFPASVQSVWNKGLPEAGLTPVKAPDFELYDARFDPETGQGEVEIWIPVA